jgi:hypothetical protein
MGRPYGGDRFAQAGNTPLQERLFAATLEVNMPMIAA